MIFHDAAENGELESAARRRKQHALRIDQRVAVPGQDHEGDGFALVYVLDIYAASEEPIPGVTAEAMVDRIRRFGHRSVAYAPSVDEAVEAILADVKEKDMVITLGAGNVWQAGDKILEGLRRA